MDIERFIPLFAGLLLPYVGSVVLKAVTVKSSVFCDITACGALKVNQCYGRTCHLHLQC
jgi:hypothetical protein